jgi:hypothetical protein
LPTSPILPLLAAAWAALVVHPDGSEPIKIAGVAALAALALRDGRVLQRLLAQRALLVSLVPLALSVVFAPEPAVALIGTSARAQGGLAAIAVALIAVHVSGLDGDGRRALQRGVALLGGVVAAYALMQSAGLDPWHWRGQPDARPVATLGNPTVLAGLLLLALPLTWLQARTAERPGRWILLASIQTGGLLVSGTRSAWLALAGVGLLLAAWNLRRRWLLPGMALLLALSVLAAVWRPASLQDRAWLWQVAARALVESPVLVDLAGQPDASARLRRWVGFGPDGQQPVLAATRAQVPGARPEAAGWDADRAHQWVLDRALEGGALGVLAGVVLAGVVARTLLRARRDPHTRAEATALCLALGAWALHLQAAFALTGDRVLGWICIGLALALAPPAQEETVAAQRRAGSVLALVVACCMLPLAAAAAGCLPSAWERTLAPALAADRAFARGQALYAAARENGSRGAQFYAQSAAAFAQAAALRRYDRDAALAAAAARIEQAAQSDLGAPAALAQAQAWIDAAARLDPRDPRLDVVRARLVAVAASNRAG